MSRILLMCIVYPPDVVSTAHIVGGLASGIRDLGHDVQVLTSVPHYNPPDGFTGPRRGRLWDRRTEDGIDVVRCYVPRKRPGLLRRAADLTLLHLGMLVAALRHCRRAEVAIVVSPPFTLAFVGFVLQMVGGTKVVFNAQELWPDVPRDLGVVKNRRLLDLLAHAEKFIYRRSAAVTAIGPRFAREIKKRSGRDKGVFTIPNFVDTDWIQPRPKQNPLSLSWGLTDRPVVLYAGNIGLTQDFGLLLRLADALPDVTVLIVGGGAGRADLEAALLANPRPNVRLEEFLPAEQVPDLYGLADIVIVPLAAGHDHSTTPSKVLTAMAAARPVLACAADGTDLAEVVKAAGAGEVVPPGDLAALVDAVERMLTDPSWSAAPALAAANSHNRAAIAAQYGDVVRTALGLAG